MDTTTSSSGRSTSGDSVQMRSPGIMVLFTRGKPLLALRRMCSTSPTVHNITCEY
jgi:hypothetical protein